MSASRRIQIVRRSSYQDKMSLHLLMSASSDARTGRGFGVACALCASCEHPVDCTRGAAGMLSSTRWIACDITPSSGRSCACKLPVERHAALKADCSRMITNRRRSVEHFAIQQGPTRGSSDTARLHRGRDGIIHPLDLASHAAPGPRIRREAQISGAGGTTGRLPMGLLTGRNRPRVGGSGERERDGRTLSVHGDSDGIAKRCRERGGVLS